ncbi:unnamed protein product [Cuscuta epithymum]|uniref:Retrotransposon Copia-like N-terminal domain-containing protein n=1 Tax=Cuscuta epithymum TaxID=186058 RepID=A0AAV0GC25_9ASTE|nr:unnamed protein product [Cuscuta epithymum]
MVVGDETKDSSHDSSTLVIDSMSPYFIQSGDEPGDVYVTTLLRDGNYGDWLDEMSNALYAKNKYGFVNGDIPMPKSGSPYLPHWQRANAMVKAWLNSSMEIELRQSVKFKTAREIWVDLQERFEKESAPRAYELRCSLGAIRQDGQSISAYFSRLRRVWDEMVSINATPSCTCDGCSCNISKQIAKSRDRDQLYDFLMGLDDAYGHLKTQILATRPVPTLTAAYHLVSEGEQHISIASSRKPSSDGVAFHIQTKKENDLGRRPITKEVRSCSHCGRTNHTYEACFERIGYPPNWNVKTNRTTGGKFRLAGNPRFLHEGEGQKHKFQNPHTGRESKRGSPPHAAHMDNTLSSTFGLSHEQLCQLAKLLKNELPNQSHASSPSAGHVNLAGLTLEEPDWDGSAS